jgi:hypothetical protein
MGFQSCESPNFENFGTSNLGILGKNDISPVAKHKEYYKGEGGGFPQARAVVSVMNLCLFMVHPCTKNAPTMH